MRYRYIIYDWNGTLLDDTDICVDILNTMLSAKNLPKVSKEKYQDIFMFPIRDYYVRAGFNLESESFEEIAANFEPLYKNAYKKCNLFDGILPMLDDFNTKGIKQIVISATEIGLLREQLSYFGLTSVLNDYIALNNYYAQSKIELAKNYFAHNNIDKNCAIIVGDTLHDAEVADSIGCDCVLFSGGHQSIEKLKTSGKTVLSSISEIKKHFVNS